MQTPNVNGNGNSQVALPLPPHATRDRLYSLVDTLLSKDPDIQVEVATELRKEFGLWNSSPECSQNPHKDIEIKETLLTETVPCLVNFLGQRYYDGHPALQQEIVWAISNLANGPAEFVVFIFSSPPEPPRRRGECGLEVQLNPALSRELVRLLSSSHAGVRLYTVLAVENIVRVHLGFRIWVLGEEGLCDGLVPLLLGGGGCQDIQMEENSMETAGRMCEPKETGIAEDVLDSKIWSSSCSLLLSLCMCRAEKWVHLEDLLMPALLVLPKLFQRPYGEEGLRALFSVARGISTVSPWTTKLILFDSGVWKQLLEFIRAESVSGSLKLRKSERLWVPALQTIGNMIEMGCLTPDIRVRDVFPILRDLIAVGRENGKVLWRTCEVITQCIPCVNDTYSKPFKFGLGHTSDVQIIVDSDLIRSLLCASWSTRLDSNQSNICDAIVTLLCRCAKVVVDTNHSGGQVDTTLGYTRLQLQFAEHLVSSGCLSFLLNRTLSRHATRCGAIHALGLLLEAGLFGASGPDGDLEGGMLNPIAMELEALGGFEVLSRSRVLPSSLNLLNRKCTGPLQMGCTGGSSW